MNLYRPIAFPSTSRVRSLSGFPGHKELQFTLHRPESPDQHSQVREREGTEVKREREKRERGGGRSVQFESDH